VTKKEIVKQIADELDETQLLTKKIVQMAFAAIVDTLVTDEDHRIELRNFGVFEVKLRKPRKARNPRTGDKVDVPAKCVVTFKPGKMMEERVRQIPPEELQTDEEDEQATAEAGDDTGKAGADSEAVNGSDLDGEPIGATAASSHETAAPRPRSRRPRKSSG
jgi:integration host factor subunit beta